MSESTWEGKKIKFIKPSGQNIWHVMVDVLLGTHKVVVFACKYIWRPGVTCSVAHVVQSDQGLKEFLAGSVIKKPLVCHLCMESDDVVEIISIANWRSIGGGQ